MSLRSQPSSLCAALLAGLALALLPPGPPALGASSARAGASPASEHDGRWLVILSSSKELGLVPAGEEVLRRSGLPHRIVRLRSSEFRGLQPCYEIVVADSFETSAEARAYGRRLAELGIDHYAKNAGAWIGREPRVEAYCRGERDGGLEEACRSPARLVATHEGRHFLSLGLDPVVAERALAGAGRPQRLTDRVWLGELGAKTLGDASVGDVWTAWTEEGGKRSCRIERFAAVTRGVPHWNDLRSGLTKPGCGEAIVMAELRCDGPGPLRLASRAGLRHPQPAGAASEEQLARLRGRLAGHPAWAGRADAARARAAEEGLELDVAFEVEAWTLGGRELLAARGSWSAGDGGCGSSLVHEAAWALVDGADGRLLIPPFATEQGDGAVVPVDLDGAGDWGVWRQRWGGVTELQRGDELLCRAPFAFCDCGC